MRGTSTNRLSYMAEPPAGFTLIELLVVIAIIGILSSLLLLGAVIGAVAGLFFGLPGILLGPFTGAFLLEHFGGRPVKEAAKAGLGALLGLAAGAVGQFVCGLVMIGIFALSVCLNSGGVSV